MTPAAEGDHPDQWATRSAAKGLSLRESARRMGAYRWVESRLFDVLGAWAISVPELEVKPILAAHAREHAWHAELWRDQLPTAGGMTPATLTSSPNEGIDAFFAALVAPHGPERTIERLVGAYRVLVPRMIAAYSAHLGVASGVSDGPVIRVLRLVLRDEVEAWSAGEAVIQALLGSETQVRTAAVHQGRLEWMIADAGGVAGLETTGSGFAGRQNGQP
ncbi:MAG TPA: hypothetical protein VK988_09485 [Acidimicrobiales bacterium]|nr:hypothetical protein [Acidimicrobiales bacterium]